MKPIPKCSLIAIVSLSCWILHDSLYLEPISTVQQALTLSPHTQLEKTSPLQDLQTLLRQAGRRSEWDLILATTGMRREVIKLVVQYQIPVDEIPFVVRAILTANENIKRWPKTLDPETDLHPLAIRKVAQLLEKGIEPKVLNPVLSILHSKPLGDRGIVIAKLKKFLALGGRPKDLEGFLEGLRYGLFSEEDLPLAIQLGIPQDRLLEGLRQIKHYAVITSEDLVKEVLSLGVPIEDLESVVLSLRYLRKRHGIHGIATRLVERGISPKDLKSTLKGIEAKAFTELEVYSYLDRGVKSHEFVFFYQAIQNGQAKWIEIFLQNGIPLKHLEAVDRLRHQFDDNETAIVRALRYGIDPRDLIPLAPEEELNEAIDLGVPAKNAVMVAWAMRQDKKLVQQLRKRGVESQLIYTVTTAIKSDQRIRLQDLFDALDLGIVSKDLIPGAVAIKAFGKQTVQQFLRLGVQVPHIEPLHQAIQKGKIEKGHLAQALDLKIPSQYLESAAFCIRWLGKETIALALQRGLRMEELPTIASAKLESAGFRELIEHRLTRCYTAKLRVPPVKGEIKDFQDVRDTVERIKQDLQKKSPQKIYIKELIRYFKGGIPKTLNGLVNQKDSFTLQELDEIIRSFDQAIQQATFRNKFYASKKAHLNLSEGRYSVSILPILPIPFQNVESKIFSLALYPTQQQRQELELKGIELSGEYFPGAIGGLWFYIEKDQLFVTDIQSDLFGKLPANLRRQYEDWAVMLLLALEDYARVQGIKKILIPPTIAYLARWSEIYPSLAFRNYAQIPKLLDYQFVQIPLRYRKLDSLRFEMAWVKKIQPEKKLAPDSLETIFADLLESIEASASSSMIERAL